MGVSPFQLLVVLIIVALIFGTKRLRGLGEDLGAAIKGFKEANKDESKEALPPTSASSVQNETENERDRV